MYAIVMILPPEPLLKELEDLMVELNLRFHTSKALVYKPHITLKSLGKIDGYKVKKVHSELEEIADKTKPFIVELNNLRFYGSSKDIPGIYISVERTNDLFNLHKRVAISLKKYEDKKDRSYKEMENYNPHITLVADDITPKELEKAKKELNTNYSNSFIANYITLLVRKESTFSYSHFRL